MLHVQLTNLGRSGTTILRAPGTSAAYSRAMPRAGYPHFATLFARVSSYFSQRGLWTSQCRLGLRAGPRPLQKYCRHGRLRRRDWGATLGDAPRLASAHLAVRTSRKFAPSRSTKGSAPHSNDSHITPMQDLVSFSSDKGMREGPSSLSTGGPAHPMFAKASFTGIF